MPIMSFEEALAMSTPGKRHLLLGNGFSVALVPGIFSYRSLFERAEFDPNGTIGRVFNLLRTEDFEVAVQAIESAAEILPSYGIANEIILDAMWSDAQQIKNKLIEMIVFNHPGRPYDISGEQIDSCIAFLKNFLDTDGKIFTLNYDILLYWVLMSGFERRLLTFNDGFSNDEYDESTPFVVWDNAQTQNQTINYLHGALHLFDAGSQLRKYTWVRTNIPLIEQAQTAVNEGAFPLFVSEGSSDKKMEKITHSGYLHKSYRNFGANHGSLFTFGFSLSQNDEHIIHAIERGKYRNIFIGLYGEQSSSENQRIIRRADKILEHLPRGSNLNFYNSASARVWSV